MCNCGKKNGEKKKKNDNHRKLGLKGFDLHPLSLCKAGKICEFNSVCNKETISRYMYIN